MIKNRQVTTKCLPVAVKCLPWNKLIIIDNIDSMIDHQFPRSKELLIDDDRQEVINHCQKIFWKTFRTIIMTDNCLQTIFEMHLLLVNIHVSQNYPTVN